MEYSAEPDSRARGNAAVPATSHPKILRVLLPFRGRNMPLDWRFSLFGLSAMFLIPFLIEAAPAPVTAFGERSSPASVPTRSCEGTSAAQAAPNGQRKSKRQPASNAKAGATACVEVQTTALDIQEYIQGFVRNQKWTIEDEETADSLWTFHRSLDADALMKATKPDENTNRAHWTHGTAFVQVGTTALSDGFTRIRITATFRGYGESVDRFAPPREFWPMTSNGTFEALLVSAVETHFKSIH